MSRRILGMVLGCAGLSIAASGCVVRGYATAPTAGGYVAVDSSQTYTVQSYPPEPVYEEVTVSPGYGNVWIDGNWHWNGYRWVWIGGRWMPERVGFVYVSPYYDLVDGRHVYRAGYWSNRDRLPRGAAIRDHRDGRPAVYHPDRRDPSYQPGVRDHRSGGAGYQPPSGPRDHRGGGYVPPSGPRDHRDQPTGGRYDRPGEPAAPQGPANNDRDHRGNPGGGRFDKPDRTNNPGGGRWDKPREPAAPQGPAHPERPNQGGGRWQKPREPAAPQGPAHPERPNQGGGRWQKPREPAAPQGPAHPEKPSQGGGRWQKPREPAAPQGPAHRDGGRDHRDDKKPNHY